MNLSKFIIIILIIIIFWIVYRNRNENMSNCKNNKVYDDGTYRDLGTNGIDKTDKSKEWYHYTNRLTNNNKIYKSRSDDKKYCLTFHKNYDGKQDFKPACYINNKEANIQVDSFKKSDDFVQKYIKEKVLDGNVQCATITDKSRSDLTRQEIYDYQDDFFEFRDKIYASSDPAIDPVDKINMVTLNDGFKSNDMTIADVYDKLVG